MDKEKINTIKLGALVSIGLIILILSVYFVGAKKNMFTSTFKIIAIFRDINGLQKGNIVRFRGYDIGTIKNMNVMNDSSVKVILDIDEKIRPNIKKNAMASIATDGLMGNKILIIHNGKEKSTIIGDNDTLQTIQPVDMDQMIQTLKSSNENVAEITGDLKKTVKKLNASNSLWELLSDTVLADNLREAIVKIKITGNNTAQVSGDLSKIILNVKQGKGTMGALLMDNTIGDDLKQAIVNIKLTSSRTATITGDLSKITERINKGQGAVGTLLMDTTFVNNLNQSMKNIKDGSANFNQDMEALKHNFLLRRYFKKQEKK